MSSASEPPASAPEPSSNSTTGAPPPPHDPYAAIRVPDYRLLLFGTVITFAGTQMFHVAVGWQIYEWTESKLALAFVGLAQVLPIFLFSLVGGHVADRFDRRRIGALAQIVRACSSLAMLWIASTRGPVEAVYVCLFVNGTTRAFHAPARTALLPQILPLELFESAVRWNTTGFQLASVCGPALGGLVIAVTGETWPVFLFDAATSAVNALCLLSIRKLKPHANREPASVESLLGGLRFVWNTKVMLAAITLDLFAVLLGGIQALLPVYAKDILQVGAQGQGWLRAAESAGALAMALAMAHRPPIRHAGKVLLWSVAGFGASIVVFGLSTNFWLSLVALGLCGACDNISVVIRHTLMQLRTPNEMRGRVAAVNMVFIASSNELGQVESGLVAHYFSEVFAAVSGGLGTILVVALAALRWPELRRLGALREEEAAPPAGAEAPPVQTAMKSDFP